MGVCGFLVKPRRKCNTEGDQSQEAESGIPDNTAPITPEGGSPGGKSRMVPVAQNDALVLRGDWGFRSTNEATCGNLNWA